MQGMDVQKRPSFSIRQGSGYVTLYARIMDASTREQIKAYIAKLRGKIYVDGEPMTKKAAFRYIIARLQKVNSVQVSVK